jgi:hypothetical protein
LCKVRGTLLCFYRLNTSLIDTGVDVSYDFATVNKFTNQKGQTIRYFIFCWPDPDLSKLKFDKYGALYIICA